MGSVEEKWGRCEKVCGKDVERVGRVEVSEEKCMGECGECGESVLGCGKGTGEGGVKKCGERYQVSVGSVKKCWGGMKK